MSDGMLETANSRSKSAANNRPFLKIRCDGGRKRAESLNLVAMPVSKQGNRVRSVQPLTSLVLRSTAIKPEVVNLK